MKVEKFLRRGAEPIIARADSVSAAVRCQIASFLRWFSFHVGQVSWQTSINFRAFVVEAQAQMTSSGS